MIVQCPYCATRYQLEEERFQAPNPMLKCSRCRHVFPAPGSKKPPSAKGRKALVPEDESLKLPFENDSWKDEEEAPPAADSDAQDGFVLGTDEEVESSLAPEADADDAQIESEAGLEDDIEIEEEPAAAEPDLTFADDDDVEDEAPPTKPPKRQKPPRSPDHLIVRALLVFLLVVVAAYGSLTWALFTSPALADRLLGPLPVIGTLASNRLRAQDVTLVGIAGQYQRIKDGTEVFVITGEVVSAAPVTLHSVEVRGRLLSSTGAVIAEKSIYCGNAVSAKILGDLTPREVSVLQKIAPPKQFGIKPGDSAPFVIVFMAPPKDAAELSAQVIAASDQG